LPFKTRPMPPGHTYEVGEQIVWFPQGLLDFHEAYAQDMMRLKIADVPDANGELMTNPMDGTANSAVVVGVESLGDSAPGWSVLRLRSTRALESDGPESFAETEDEAEEFSLPVAEPLFCDVDQHVCDIGRYLSCRERLAANPHVSVFFATPPNEDGLQPATEDEWEGRVFDTAVQHSPDYPHSAWKSARVVWYREVASPTNTAYVIPNEQTDNEVSPWETFESSAHRLWKQKHPTLAAMWNNKQPRLARRLLLHPESQPESMDLQVLTQHVDDVEMEAVKRVLKRLCSNEASRLFYHPVDTSETQYYEEIENPISLIQIADRFRKGWYSHFCHFHEDVTLMVSNCLTFNEDHRSEYILGLVMHEDLKEATQEITQSAPELVANLAVAD